MGHDLSRFLPHLALGAFFLTVAAPGLACDPPQTREATSAQVGDFTRSSGKSVLTFIGYSGAEYEDVEAMKREATTALARYDPAKTLVNIGATAPGIGAVYAIAKSKGFVTMGIVSTQARDQKIPLADCVDFVFYVRDGTWGGLLPNSDQLSPTSAALVENSTAIVGIGGGEIGRDEMLGARRAGKSVTFIPADMNHRIAIEKAQQKGLPAPTEFGGAAHPALIAR